MIFVHLGTMYTKCYKSVYHINILVFKSQFYIQKWLSSHFFLSNISFFFIFSALSSVWWTMSRSLLWQHNSRMLSPGMCCRMHGTKQHWMYCKWGLKWIRKPEYLAEDQRIVIDLLLQVKSLNPIHRKTIVNKYTIVVFFQSYTHQTYK